LIEVNSIPFASAARTPASVRTLIQISIGPVPVP